MGASFKNRPHLREVQPSNGDNKINEIAGRQDYWAGQDCKAHREGGERPLRFLSETPQTFCDALDTVLKIPQIAALRIRSGACPDVSPGVPAV